MSRQPAMNGGAVLFLLGALAWLPTAATRAETAVTPPAWLSRVEAPLDPASVTAPRPFKADYRITWAGFNAAKVNVDCSLEGNEVRSRLKTSTAGMARSLWQMDAVHLAIADRRTLRPVRIEETDKRESKEITTRVEFPPGAAVRWTRTVLTGEPTPAEEPKIKPKRFEYPNLLDMHTALLQLRNVPLQPGESHTVLVMTATNPYLVTVKAVARETVEVKAGRRAAIRCTVALGKVGKDGVLQTQKKFKSANVWVSDDSDRTLLKVEAKVFVGTVVLELERVVFPEPAPR